MRNHLLIMFSIFIGSVVYTPATAQSATVKTIENSVKKDGKYALLVSNARYFQAAVNSGNGLKAKYPEVDFQVVLIGPVVRDLATDDSLKSVVEISKKAGIRVVVCESAMKHFEFTKTDYHHSIAFTPSGFVYIFGLLESGFKTITL